MTAGVIRHGFRYLTFLLPFVVVVPVTQAGDMENRERAAKTACLSGDYVNGVGLLAELFVDTGEINYLFNQGRCFEQNGRYADAIARFREFLRKNKDAGKATDEVAERHIADCQAWLDKQTPQTVPPVQTTTDHPPTVGQAVPVAQPEPPLPIPVAPMTQPGISQVAPTNASSGSGLRMGGIAIMSVGVVSIATGVLLNMKANSLTRQLEESTSTYSRNKDSTRSYYQIFGWVGYGAGTACMLSGAILYYLGHSQNSQVVLVPTAQLGQVGAILQGAF